jgi:hypothetical protein
VTEDPKKGKDKEKDRKNREEEDDDDDDQDEKREQQEQETESFCFLLTSRGNNIDAFVDDIEIGLYIVARQHPHRVSARGLAHCKFDREARRGRRGTTANKIRTD